MSNEATTTRPLAPKKKGGAKTKKRQRMGATSRVDSYRFDPETLVIIGLDTPDGEEHELYDERIHLPLVEETVLNIMVNGVIEPVVVRPNGDVAEVLDGRQRVRHAREANRRLKAQGEPPVLVPAVTHRASSPMAIMVSTNEHRQDDTPMARARKLERMLARGYTLEDCAVHFGKTVQCMRNWASLLDCDKKVQRAVDDGKLTASAAQKLAKLDKQKQVETMQEMIASGDKGHDAARRRVKAETNGTEVAAKPPGKRVLTKMVETYQDEALRPLFEGVDVNEDVIKGIRIALGDLNPKAVKGLTAALKELGWKG